MLDVPQGSDAWRLARCGKITASRIADLTAQTKSGYGASRANYMAELVIERLTGQPVERYQNEAMRWGTQQEPRARLTYELVFNAPVEEVGFVPHPSIRDCGASPDGYVGDRGLLEIKAPGTAAHLEMLLGEVIADGYVKQMQFQMACTGRDWCDFLSYDPRMPARMQIWIKRVRRDQPYIAELEREVAKFIKELDGKVAQLTRRYGAAA